VGSGKPQSVTHLAGLLGGPQIFIPKRPGEPDVTFADLRKITRMTGWRPRIAFEEGVRRMLACIDDWRDAPLWTPQMIEEATQDWFRYLTPLKTSACSPK